MRKPLALCWMLTMLSCGDVPPGERIEAKSDAVAGTEDSAKTPATMAASSFFILFPPGGFIGSLPAIPPPEP